MKLRPKLIAAAGGVGLLVLLAWRLTSHPAERDGPNGHSGKPVPVTAEAATGGDVPLYVSGIGTI